MKLMYYCEYCHRLVDTLEVEHLDETALGFDILSPEERKELLQWSKNGRVGFVKIICEDCEENLRYSAVNNSPAKGIYYQ